MAQVTTTFELSPFDARLAASGALCLAAQEKRDITGEKKYITSGGEHFYGAGICKETSSGKIEFTAKGRVCLFTKEGLHYNENAKAQELSGNWVYMQLYMAKVVNYTEEKTAGGAVSTMYKTTVTKDASGNISSVTTADLENLNTVLIDNLNARDQFAIQALRGIMEHIEDPSMVGDDLMLNYCRIAYRWAKYMMQMAADARAAYVDEDPGTLPVDNLESNTEKLLYNVVANLNDLGDKVKTGLNDVVDAIKGEQSE